MDLSTILGICAAFGLMLMAILQGGPLSIFINIPSIMIVFGGTAGNILVHYPFADVFDAINVAKKTFLYKETSASALIDQLMDFANKARKEGILALQASINTIEDPFLLKAVQMAVDGQEPETLRRMLMTEIDYIQVRHEKGGDIFNALALYAPAMGMVGTLIGLVQMLQTMDDPSTIGPAMAVALLTTFYGAVIANVVCTPMAGKLRNRSDSEILTKTLIAEGMQSILSGENPRIMEQKLHAFIAPKLRDSTFNK
ncbi:motility protein A [Desulfotalea psychrophila]|uniref:Related to flagellar motor apparatus (MotA) n=1 Tax=Desulfotalea psychrophila (strain LSv54 / DSM 12343) TaxID=177439 RepID=Q6AJT2_DESPS|nr:MotA/TolQ/ExbB proton channel family protein [Desulfotalea psychrophila]CAG37394.1 related to flagellar motor apparatus (MotA) [Desulfotalea psychrophila LSv54]